MTVTTSGNSITFNDASTQTTAYPGVASTSFTTIQRFSAPGNFTTPANVTQVQLAMVSGGGGGAGGSLQNGGYGGAGGAGIVAAGIYTVAASTPYAVTVGNGGNGSYPSNGGNTSPGNSGNASSFGNILTANGGAGGNGYTPNTNGNTGAAGTAPLAEASTSAGTASGFAMASGGNPGGGDSGNAQGGGGGGGAVLIYF